MKLALGHRPSPVRQVARSAKSQGRKAVVVHSMMGPYQYKARVARLRLKGGDVHDFGERVLQQGSYGDDVMQLQAYLAEEGYFNSADGLSGYFGAVTTEALQNWQRDLGVRVTGVFNDECKWAYLRQQESALKSTQIQGNAAVVALTAGEAAPAGPPPLTTGALGLAAVAAGMALTSSSGRAAFGRGASWAAQSAAGVAAGAATGVTAAAKRVVSKLPKLPKLPNHKEEVAKAAAKAAAAAAAVAARKAIAEEVANLQAGGGVSVAPPAAGARRSPPPQGQGSNSKLSDEEVQQRIAVMKGEMSPRAPMPQRPAPKPLPRPVAASRPADDPIRGSKYGTYYGGRQVREQVKQYLDTDTGAHHGNHRGTTAASRRMEAIGYQIARARKATGKPGGSDGFPERLPAGGDSSATATVAVAALPAVDAEAEDLLRDVIEATAVPVEVETVQPVGSPVPANVLLSGTELEAPPERRGRPVPVVKAGMAMPAAGVQPAVVASAATTPRAVPVVKPQRRATIGDMLRASKGNNGQESPAAALYPSTSSSKGYAAVPPATSVPNQQAAAPGPRAASLPVNTGSNYAAAVAAAAVAPAPAAQPPAPVQYNADGSVVLAGKPIKLVKPAHLLPKTYGFENMAAAEQAGEQATESSDREQSDEDVFGGYRRRNGTATL